MKHTPVFLLEQPSHRCSLCSNVQPATRPCSDPWLSLPVMGEQARHTSVPKGFCLRSFLESQTTLRRSRPVYDVPPLTTHSLLTERKTGLGLTSCAGKMFAFTSSITHQQALVKPLLNSSSEEKAGEGNIAPAWESL